MEQRILEEIVNTLCGDLIASGSSRSVFAHAHRPDLVVKVEDAARSFQNIREWTIWEDFKHDDKAAKWLAPCVSISPWGSVLVQRRVSPLPHDFGLPARLPHFLTDLKPHNFGILEGRLVCCDYGSIIYEIEEKEKAIEWNENR